MDTTSAATADHPAAFAGTRLPLLDASHAPGDIYSSEDIFRLEKARIFMKEWLCVGRTEEVADPGDYMTLRIMDEPVLVVRNQSGEINAFANLCLHRGVEIASGCGSAQVFSCPYHAWSYNLDGQLLGAGYMQDTRGFDRRHGRLKRLHSGEWGGWLFVNLSAEPVPLDEHLADFKADLALLGMEDCRIGSKLVIDLPTNWKFMVENLLDVYHSQTLHANSFGKFRADPDKHPLIRRKNGGTFRRYQGAPMTPNGKTLFRRMPALESQPDDFSVSAHLAPNMQVISRIDHMHPLIMWPLTSTTSRTVIYNLYPKEFLDDPEFREKVKVYDDFLRLVLDEDSSMVVSLQKAMVSENFRPGRMSKLEDAIHHVLNDYLDRVFGPDRLHPAKVRTG